MRTKKLNGWNISAERFVVFLDIMGFKDYISRNSHKDVYNRMLKFINRKNLIERRVNSFLKEMIEDDFIYSTTFSDSIILFSKDNSSSSLATILFAASDIMYSAFKDSIPMKGAISYGLMSVNIDKQIYLGQPLIDAYLLQDQLFYYGVIAHHSLDNFISSNGKKMESVFFLNIDTPLKTGLVTHNNLNWFVEIPTKNSNDMFVEGLHETNFRKGIEKLKGITSGQPRKYIDNTVSVYNRIFKS